MKIWRPTKSSLAMLGVAMLLAGCGGESTTREEGGGGGGERSISGTVFVEIYDQSINRIRTGTECRMGPRYGAGTQVTVQNGSGETVGVGALKGWADNPTISEDGFAHDADLSVDTNGLATYCMYLLEVGDVPEDDFYEFVIDGRNVHAVSREELEQADWRVEITMAGR